MRGRLKALFLLALALIRTLWRLLWGGGRGGLERFKQNYADDGLTAVSSEEREAMRSFGRCIACGRCDAGDADRIVASRGRFRGTMNLVLAASRSMPDYRAAAEGFDYLSREALRDKEGLCPTRVPLSRLAQFVRENATAARISVPASQGEKSVPSSMPASMPAPQAEGD
jgi:hypothetical protein